jgi:hypothetical protein|tara:strand:+ start:97 stop:654 length:558 start_codon:yes stop_codon:yes gene_type:complete
MESMNHFAEIDEKGIVLRVIVAEHDFINSGAVGEPSNWIQTSCNTYKGEHFGQDGYPDGGVALRKNYAIVGGIYDKTRDAFISPQPFPSWILNEDTCDWDPPVNRPWDGPAMEALSTAKYEWEWVEETISWRKRIPVCYPDGKMVSHWVLSDEEWTEEDWIQNPTLPRREHLPAVGEGNLNTKYN